MMKKVGLIVIVIMSFGCSPNSVTSQSAEEMFSGDIGYEIISKTDNYIEKINIKLKEPLEEEPEFIYLFIGNVLEGNCNRFKINFKIGHTESSKDVKLLKFDGKVISLDISKKKLTNINALFFYYSDTQRKYHDAIYYDVTKELLEEVNCI